MVAELLDPWHLPVTEPYVPADTPEVERVKSGGSGR